MEILFFLLAFHAGITHAQSPSPTIHFAGVVQHVQGQVQRLEPGQSPIGVSFQTILYERETLQVAANAYLKFITREDCVGVVYGPAQVTVPSPGDAWRVQAESVRWICPAARAQKLRIRGVDLGLDGGEFFLHGKQILLLRDQVTTSFGGEPLRGLSLYTAEHKKWEKVADHTDEQELWKFDHLQPIPKESRVLEKPKQAPNWRFILEPALGFTEPNHENENLNHGVYGYDGFRLQLQHRYKEMSWIAAIVSREMQDPAQKGTHNGPPPVSSASDIKMTSIEGGVRLHHDRWWSPYARIGLGREQNKLSIQRSDISYFSMATYNYIAMSLSAGLDALYSPKWLNWLGVYGAMEVEITQTLFPTDSSVDNESSNTASVPPEASNQHGFITTASGIVSLGIFAQF